MVKSNKVRENYFFSSRLQPVHTAVSKETVISRRVERCELVIIRSHRNADDDEDADGEHIDGIVMHLRPTRMHAT